MFQPLYVAATGLEAIQDEMSDITNNLANAKTIAFKKGRVEKESMFYADKSFSSYLSDAAERQEQHGDISRQTTAPIQYGTGVRVISTPKDYTQGTIENTSNPLDIAISGEGFFQFRMPDGSPAYGRAGALHVDDAGNLVDTNGRFLDPPVTFPEGVTSVLIKPDGTVYVAVNNSNDFTEIGQITLAKFPNREGLKSLGQNLYAASPVSGEAIISTPGQEGYGVIQQSALEQSNVDVLSEMMRMLMVQRVFDTITKAVSSYEAMLTTLERMKG